MSNPNEVKFVSKLKRFEIDTTLMKNYSHLKTIEKVIQGGRSEHLTWDLENFQICLIYQTPTSKLIMIKASNGKVFNIKVVPLGLTFPKSPRSSHLAKG